MQDFEHSNGQDNEPLVTEDAPPVTENFPETSSTLRQQYESPLMLFGGFMKAGSKTRIEAGEDAHQKALSLFSEDNDLHPSDRHVVPSENGAHSSLNMNNDSSIGIKSPCEQPPLHNENDSNARTIIKDTNATEKSITTETPDFTTGRGRPIQFSSGTHMLNVTQGNEHAKKQQSVSCGGKRSAAEARSNDDDYRYENILSEYGGFRMGNSKSVIPVSVEAKRQAVELFNNETVPTQAEQSNQRSTSADIILTENPEVHNNSIQAVQMPANDATDSMKHTTASPLRILSFSSQKRSYKRRPVVHQTKVKPFKSPVVHANLEKTKAAIQKTEGPSVRARNPSIFDLQVPRHRQNLSDLGLPLQYSVDELRAMNISDEIIYMTASKAKHFSFNGWGPDAAYKAMIDAGAVSTSLPSAWVENHYKWIIWKMACMIRSYPRQFSDSWTPEKVLEQLCYRYEREINQGQQSVLKRIIEQDDVAVKHMVLAVADIVDLKADSNHQAASPSMGKALTCKLVLTDGWYEIPAMMDARMQRAVETRKLKIGHKLSICGAQLMGSRVAKSPLAALGDTTLSISTNSCLPAKWDARLGYQSNGLLTRSISSLFEDGGTATAIDVVIWRKYPIMYSETLPNGNTITRTASEEEDRRNQLCATIYQGEQSDILSIPNLRLEYDDDNTSAMGRYGSGYNNGQRSTEERKVSGYFKLRIGDYRRSQSNDPISMATLLILNANEVNYMDVQEGNRYRITFLAPYTPKIKRFPGLHLKTTRYTRWELISKATEDMVSKFLYIPRQITQCEDIHTMNQTDDMDVAVFVLHAGSATQDQHVIGRTLWHQTLLVTDASQQLCQIKLRLPTRPLSGIEGQVIGCMNLRYDLFDQKFGIIHLKFTDDSELFIKKPSSNHMQRAMTDLKSWVQSHPDALSNLYERVNALIH
ncbi:uncharacterized protein BYT42DRAFT_249628 [Radiomyces spectabilis]|uniref:uncharacterized protein n=1 Tax=Radiomyces spectabilis TaxID=64574 RepID=UPI00222085A7|nr:uncharacterized protein BYT42DRAFT_249628 [Radiomyces spectabilis]KAI8388854.1 hypothetical protein BYT42DRAFT_249628 [Radiomyces spectabilis]